MARTLTSGNYLSGTVAALGQAGAIFFRLKPNWNGNDGAIHHLWEYQESGALYCSFQKYLDNNLYVGWNLGIYITVAATAHFTSGTWGNWLYTWDAAIPEMFLYLDGTQLGTNTGAPFINAPTSLGVGSRADGSSSVNGDGAEFGRWNRVPTAGERAVLQVTGCPLNVPNGLVQHLPLVGGYSPEIDFVSRNALALAGTPAAARHPRVFYPALGHVGRAGVTLTHYSLTAAAGSFALAGQAAVLKTARLLTAAQGSFTFSGQTAALSKGRTLGADAGSFALSGQAATLRIARRLTAASASFALTGQDAVLRSPNITLTAAAGAFALTGQAATLSSSQEPFVPVVPVGRDIRTLRPLIR